MKRYWLLISAVLCLTLTLSACTSGANFEETEEEREPVSTPEEEKPFVPQTARELWDKIDGTMEDTESYRMVQTLSFTADAYGHQVELSGTATGYLGKDWSYRIIENHYAVEELSILQDATQIEAYLDGVAYFAQKDDFYDQKLCSEMPFEEFQSRVDPPDPADEADLADCTNADFSQNEDGTWTLHFSGYTKRTLNLLLESLDMEETFGVDVEDLSVDVVANGDFTVKTIKMDLHFASAGSTTESSYTTLATYSEYGTAAFPENELKKEEYTSVDDALFPTELEKAIVELQDAVKAELEVTSVTTLESQGEKESLEERSFVSYGVKNNRFYHDFTLESDDEKQVVVAYENGVVSYKFDGEEESFPSSDEAEKERICNVIDTGRFFSGAVTAVEKKADGSYHLKCEKVNPSDFEDYFESLGLEPVAVSAEFFAEMKDGAVSSIHSMVNCMGSYSYGGKTENVVITLEIELSVKTLEATQDSASVA